MADNNLSLFFIILNSHIHIQCILFFKGLEFVRKGVSPTKMEKNLPRTAIAYVLVVMVKWIARTDVLNHSTGKESSSTIRFVPPKIQMILVVLLWFAPVIQVIMSLGFTILLQLHFKYFRPCSCNSVRKKLR